MADIDVIAGVAEKDWDSFANKVIFASAQVKWIHVTIADGTMGTDATLTDFTKLPDLMAELPHLSFEAHLVCANPEKYAHALTDAGFTRLIAHVECNDPRRFLAEAKYDEVEVGIAMDGATEIEEVEPFLEEVDFVVVMSAEAGATGGTFLPEAVEKVKIIRQNLPDLPIEVVGGITESTVKSVKDAGATRIVSTAYLFGHPEGVEAAVETLASA
ncbi:MAG: hypothetical protein ACOY3M_02130 [Patescibacteria group bacterium]